MLLILPNLIQNIENEKSILQLRSYFLKIILFVKRNAIKKYQMRVFLEFLIFKNSDQELESKNKYR